MIRQAGIASQTRGRHVHMQVLAGGPPNPLSNA